MVIPAIAALVSEYRRKGGRNVYKTVTLGSAFLFGRVIDVRPLISAMIQFYTLSYIQLYREHHTLLLISV